MTAHIEGKHPTANKGHECHGCLGVIHKGETYYRYKIGNRDDREIIRLHEGCEAIRHAAGLNPLEPGELLEFRPPFVL